MSRRAHYLRGNKGSRRPRRLLFCEIASRVTHRSRTTTWHEFDVGVLCLSRYTKRGERVEEWFETETPEEFNAVLLSKSTTRETMVCCAFNAGRVLWLSSGYEFLRQNGYTLSFFFSRADRYGLSTRNGKRRLKFLAMENFYPGGFAAVADGFDMEPPATHDNRAWARYRVEVARDAMYEYLALLDEIGGGNFTLTVSAQSMKLFTHKHMHHKILVGDDPKILALERKSYFGGRCECRRVGALPPGPYYVLDINSSYPAAMADNPYPIRPINYLRTPTVETVRLLTGGQTAIADVALRTDLPLYPCRADDRVYYPVGEFRTTLCTRSLQEALARNHVTEVFECVTYKSAMIFDRYVEALWEYKRFFESSSNWLKRSVVKLLLNSLYGKLGQQIPNTTKTEVMPLSPNYRRSGITQGSSAVWTETSLMGKVWLEEGRTESNESVPAVAAHVTDYARWRLWEIVDFIGYDTVLYMDTDSVIVTVADFGLLVEALSDGQLGGLELRRIVNRLDIYGPRDYVADEERFCSGVKAEWAQVRLGEFVATGWPSTIGLLDGVPEGRYPHRHFNVTLGRRHYDGLRDVSGRILAPTFSLARPPGLEPLTIPDPALRRPGQKTVEALRSCQGG